MSDSGSIPISEQNNANLGNVKKSIIRRYRYMSMGFGVTMGLIFPFFAAIFTTYRVNWYIIPFTLSCILAGIIVGAFSFYIGKVTILKTIRQIQEKLHEIAEGNLTKGIEVDSNDEIGQMAVDFNLVLAGLQKLLAQVKYTSKEIVTMVSELTLQTHETSTASTEQSASIKEIVATMDSLRDLTQNINFRVNDVLETLGVNIHRVDKGMNIVHDSLVKMAEVKKTNFKIIEDIKTLNNMISHIGEILLIISQISDRTKIVAFAAELEASDSGVTGEKFQVVATEIRRLVDITVESTEKIKNRISEIQTSSDQLAQFSELGKTRTSEGWKLSKQNEEIFQEIRSSSFKSESSANDVVDMIDKQIKSFEQIRDTVKYISGAMETFSINTRTISRASKKLEDMVGELNNIVARYEV